MGDKVISGTNGKLTYGGYFTQYRDIKGATLALQAQLASKDIGGAGRGRGGHGRPAQGRGDEGAHQLRVPVPLARGGVDPGQAALGAGEFESAPVAADDTSKLGLEVLALRGVGGAGGSGRRPRRSRRRAFAHGEGLGAGIDPQP